MKSPAKGIGKILLCLTITLLLCEGVVRLLGAGGTTLTRGALHTYDEDAGWICRPGLDTRFARTGSFNVRVRCNSRGLRDREHALAKPKDTRRIVVLGDSFMWGYGVENEEMFSTRLEERLPGWEAINLGVNGYSTVQELVRLEGEGMRYAPDFTVLAVCWNDLEDNFDDKDGGRPVARLEADGSLRIANRPVRRHWKSPVKQWFRQHSRLFALGEYGLELWKARMKEKRRAESPAPSPSPGKRTSNPPSGEKGPNESNAPEKNPKASNPKQGKPEEGKWTMEFSMPEIYAPPGPEMDRAFEAARLLLDRIRTLAESRGGRLLVIYVASKETMNPEIFAGEMAARSGGRPPSGLDPDRPARRLGKICHELGIAFLDLNPLFRRRKNPLSLFLEANYHWNAAGHRLAAEATAEKILSLEQTER